MLHQPATSAGLRDLPPLAQVALVIDGVQGGTDAIETVRWEDRGEHEA